MVLYFKKKNINGNILVLDNNRFSFEIEFEDERLLKDHLKEIDITKKFLVGFVEVHYSPVTLNILSIASENGVIINCGVIGGHAKLIFENEEDANWFCTRFNFKDKIEKFVGFPLQIFYSYKV